MSFEEAKDCLDDFIKENSKLSNEDKIQFYSLYKQATVGDNNTSCPLFQGLDKWDSWKAKQGMSQDDAKEAYITLVLS